VNSHQAYQTLNVNSDTSLKDLKVSYRKLALELHPDKNKEGDDGKEFKKITEAYHILKKEFKKSNPSKRKTSQQYTGAETKKKHNFKDRSKWGPSPSHPPEEDWGRFTKDFEVEDPAGWKEYERKFWKKYNKTTNASGKNGEFEKTREPKEPPNIFVDVDHSLCIGCCSCETIAPEVFLIDKLSRMNPKSSVINQKGAGFNKIMDAARTCPTKAISVDDVDTKTRLFPF